IHRRRDRFGNRGCTMRTRERLTRAEYRRDGRSCGDGDMGSLIGLIRQLRDDVIVLLRQEVDLVKAETQAKMRRLTGQAVTVGAGAAVAYLGAGLVMMGVATGLGVALNAAGLGVHAWWLAPILVGIVVLAVGYACVHAGIARMKDESLTPKHTAESL